MSSLKSHFSSDVEFRRLGRIATRIQEIGQPEADPLSVYLGRGVVRRSEQHDNHNVLGEDLSKYQVVRPGDLVFNRLRTWQGGFGASKHSGIVSPAYVVARPVSADARYLAYVLQSSAYLAELTRLSKWMPPSQFDILWRDLASVEIPWRPSEEQRRIADFLDDRVARIDQIIAARRVQLGLISHSRDSAITDSLLRDEFSQLGAAPWFTAHQASGSLVRIAFKWLVIDCKHRTPEYLDAGYPVLSPGDIEPGRLEPSKATRFVGEEDYLDLADELRRCRPGDLVYSRNASAGIAAYVDTEEPFTMGQDVCRITSHDENQLYLAYCLNYLTRPQLEAASVGATFTRINVAQIKSLVVPYRTHREQNALAEQCDRLEDEAKRSSTCLARSIELLTEYKQSLITAAVTGELDVTTASSEIPG